MKTIIIGGVAAGMTAAAKLKRLDASHTIHVYERGTDLSYSGCGMPYFLGDIVSDESKLIARYQDDFKKQGIDVFLKHEVLSVNPTNKYVTVNNLISKETFVDKYDHLIIATGTIANKTRVKGRDDHKIFMLNQLPDMRKIKPEVIKGNGVAIIGGGYIGVELAENLAHKGLTVHIIQRGNQLLNVYDYEVALKAKTALEAINVQVHLNENLMAYERHHDTLNVITDKAHYPVDFVIESIGVKPNTDFVNNIGLAMLKNGAIITNDHGETTVPNIYAAGDCAAYYHLIKNDYVFVPLGTHANKTGRVVAENIAGLKTTFPGIIGTNIIKVADLAFAKTGIGIDEAKQLGFDYDYVDVTALHQTSYYPGAKELFIRLIFENNTGLIKGAQLVGEKGVSDRINIMALAIIKKLTAQEFAQLDFAYAPPFSPVWDPLLVAANQIKV
ncbi:MAG: FAD-dependent oxidoreductase [Candidatus Izemoplasmataceae bacterium]